MESWSCPASPLSNKLRRPKPTPEKAIENDFYFNFFNFHEKFPESLMTNSNIKLRIIDNFTSEKIENILKDIGIAPHRQMEMVSD